METTAPHMPKQNGRSERDNRTIVESDPDLCYMRSNFLYSYGRKQWTQQYIFWIGHRHRVPKTVHHMKFEWERSRVSHIQEFLVLKFSSMFPRNREANETKNQEKWYLLITSKILQTTGCTIHILLKSSFRGKI